MSVNVRETGYGKWKIVMVFIAVIVIAGCFFSGMVLGDSKGVHLSDNSVRIEIAEGEGMDTAAEKLASSGVIKYPSVFKVQAKIGGYAQSLQPGAATINDGMSYKEILEAGLVTREDFYAALNPEDYNYRFLENIPQRENRLEGYLFPATYEIPAGMTAHDIVDLMLSAFNNQFKDEYYERAAFFGMTVDQVITMASIVERETDSDSERAKVAGVFYNRRNSGMKFQSCATVQYILGERKPVLTIADTQIDSPYNTYLYPDFPIGPICNPGLNCIEAALYPEATDAYYFVLGKNGQHVFSTTYEDHLAAMAGSDPTMSVDGSAIENQDSMKR